VTSRLLDPARQAWPMGDILPTTPITGIDTAKVRAGVDAAFANPAGLTAGVIVVHKGRIVPALSPERQAATTTLAIGDDRTDEDLFAALPPEAITVRVGPGDTRARFRLDGVTGVRQLLRSLLETGVVAVPEQR